jgi:hypothetical protein
LQAFSESLIAATKSFSQNSASNGSSKIGRQQSDGTTAPSMARNGRAVVSPAVSQQAQGTGAVVTAPQTRFRWSTAFARRSTGLAGQFTRSLAAVGSAVSESKTSQPGKAKTGVTPTNIASPVALQSKLTAVRTPTAQPATTDDTQTRLAIPVMRNTSMVHVADILSIVAQASNAQASASQPSIVHSSYSPAQMPLAGLTTTQDASTGADSHTTKSALAPVPIGIQSSTAKASIAQTSISQQPVVQSNATPIRELPSGLTNAQGASTGVSSQPAPQVATAVWNDTESGIVPTYISQPAVIRSNSSAASMPAGEPATSRNAIAGLASPTLLNVPSAGLGQIQAIVAQTSNVPASISKTSIAQTADVQSPLSLAQAPLAMPATTKVASNFLASQPTRSLPTTGWNETVPSFVSTSDPRSAVVESNHTAVQMAVAQSTTTQSDSTGVASQPERNLLTIGWNETVPSFTSTSNPRSAVIESNFTTVQMPVTQSATTQSDSTGVASQPTRNVPTTGWNETVPSFVPTSNPRTAVIESSFTTVQMPVTQSATTQSDSTGVASQPTRNVQAAGWNETAPSFTSTSNPRSAVVESNHTAVQMPVAQSAATEVASNLVASQPARNLPTAGLNENAPSFTLTSNPRSAVVDWNHTAVQMPVAVATTTQKTSTVVANQPTQTVPAARLPEAEPSIARASTLPASTQQRGISQPVDAHSSFKPMQTPLAGPVATQNVSTVVAGQDSQNPPAERLSETESSITPATVSQPVATQSKVTSAQTPLAVPVDTRNDLTFAGSQPTQTLQTAWLPEAEPSIAQTSVVPADISQRSIVQPAAVQSIVEPMQMPLARAATTQNTSTVVASQPMQTVPAETLPETESSVAQANILPGAVVQSKIAPIQAPLAVPVATKNVSNVESGQDTQNLPAERLPEAESTIARTSNPQPVAIQSKVTSTTPLAVSVATKNDLTDAAGQLTQTLPAVPLPEIESSIAPTNVPQRAVVQSNIAPIQAPLAVPVANDLTVVSGKDLQNLPAERLLETESNVAPAPVSQPVAMQTRVTMAQTPLAGAATTQNTSSVVASQSMQTAPAARLTETESSVAQASVFPQYVPQISIAEPVAIQSSVASAQIPLTGAATTQNTSNVVASQPMRTLPAASLPETQSSIAQTNIPQGAVDQSNIAPIQAPFGVPAATKNDLTVVDRRPTQTVPAAKLPEAESSIAESSVVPATISQESIVQPIDAHSSVEPMQVTLAGAATAQNTSAGQPKQTVPAASLPESEPNIAQVSVVPADISEPGAVQMSVEPMQTSLAVPVATQKDSTVVDAQPVQTVRAARPSETESSIAPAGVVPASISQRSVVQTVDARSSVEPMQTPPAEAATAQNDSTVVAARPTQDATAVKHSETESNIAPASVVPADLPHRSIAQPTAVQSNVAPVQTPRSGVATTQNDSTLVAGQPTQTVTVAKQSETESSIAAANLPSPPIVESSVAPLGKGGSESLSELPGNRTQEMTAPIAVSTKSGNDDPSTVTAAIPNAAPAADATASQDSLPKIAQNALSGAVQSAVANDPKGPNQVPVVRAALLASAKDAVASTLKTGSTVQSNPQPAAIDQTSASETITVPDNMTDPLVSWPISAGSIEAIQTGVSSLKSVPTAKSQPAASTSEKGSSTDQTGSKKNAEPVSDAGSRSSSQDAPSSSNQGFGGNTAQAQNAAPIPVNAPVHSTAVNVPEQNTATVSQNHASATQTGSAGVTTKTPENAAHVSTALPQSAPVINTAKLIQSMGQSEMRVGMRSNEFGNISISTSTTRDLVSAQISLEHGELAKTLAAHLPEIQAKLGSNQAVDVRIDMNGAAAGQGTGTFGGTANGSAEQSRSSRQQAGNIAQSQPGIGTVEQQFSSAAVAVPTGYAHLDIRV